MIYCPGCGTANREGSRYCNQCGSLLVEEEAVSCPRCGSANPSTVAHCQECGLDLARLRLEEAGPSEEVAGGDVPPQPKDEVEGTSPDGRAAIDLRARSLPPWLDSVELPGEEATPGGRVTRDSELDEGDLPRLPRDEWSADAIPIEPIVGVPYRARERPEQPPSAELESDMKLFAAVAEEEFRPSPRQVSEAPRPRRLEAGLRWLTATALLCGVVAALIWPLEPFTAAGAASAPVAAAAKVISELPPGTTVLVAFEYDASLAGELQPIAEAYLHQLLTQRLQVLLVSTEPEGPALAEMALDRVLPAHTSARYGQTVLNLGYVAGGEAAVRGLATNMMDLVRADYRQGLPLQDLAITAGVTGVRELPLIVVLGRDLVVVQRWVEQVTTPYGTRLVVGVPALVEPVIGPYRATGQLQGIVAGLSGAAAYERLLAYRGSAGGRLGAVRAGAWVGGGLVVLMNVGVLLGQLRRRQRDQGAPHA